MEKQTLFAVSALCAAASVAGYYQLGDLWLYEKYGTTDPVEIATIIGERSPKAAQLTDHEAAEYRAATHRQLSQSVEDVIANDPACQNVSPSSGVEGKVTMQPNSTIYNENAAAFTWILDGPYSEMLPCAKAIQDKLAAVIKDDMTVELENGTSVRVSCQARSNKTFDQERAAAYALCDQPVVIQKKQDEDPTGDQAANLSNWQG